MNAAVGHHLTVDQFVRLMRVKQLRAFEFLGNPLPMVSVWDPVVPDARVRDPKKRGIIQTQWGPGSHMYCTDCGRRSPYAISETILKTTYKCLRCLRLSGPPRHAICPVPGSESI